MLQSITLASLMLSVSTATASSLFSKRDSWGPAFSLGPAAQEIISTTTTIYPGKMPSNQPGYLFAWLGISNGTGDLIQSVVGSYPKGQSQCTGPDADTTWCVSSEVFGNGANGYPNQWVGDLQTADTDFENGIKLTYTLADKATYLWTQTMEDAVTGKLLSSFNKTSGPMLGWGTALECQDFEGKPCKGTVEEQTFVDSTIVLASADNSFVRTLGAGNGVTHTDMVSSDGGKVWTIAKITIPAMTSETTSASANSAAAVDTNTDTDTNTNADVAAAPAAAAPAEIVEDKTPPASRPRPSAGFPSGRLLSTGVSKPACEGTGSPRVSDPARFRPSGRPEFAGSRKSRGPKPTRAPRPTGSD